MVAALAAAKDQAAMLVSGLELEADSTFAIVGYFREATTQAG